MKKTYSLLLLLVAIYLPAMAQLPAITGTKVACVGQTTTLSIAATGGIWVSDDPDIAGVNSTLGEVYGVSNGTTTITYLVSESSYATTTVTINGAGSITGPSTVCVGSTITLANAKPGGTWSASGGKATVNAGGVVTGTVAGVATISYKLTACPTVFTTKTVNVLTPPAAITGLSSLCTGATSVYANATPDGTWSSGNAKASVDAETGLVTGLEAGVAVISYTNTVGCSKTKNITINQSPSAIAGNFGPICVGGTLSFSNDVAGGVWSSNAPTRATVSASGGVNAISGGTAKISYALGTCVATTIVTVNPLPTNVKATPSGICKNTTSALSASPAGGTWSTADVNVAISGTPAAVTGYTEGTATLTYTAPETFCYKTTIVTVNPLPADITGNTGPICAGQFLNLTNTSDEGIWSSSSTSIVAVSPTSGSITTTATGIAAGTARISYTLPTTQCRAVTIVTVSARPTTARISYSSFCIGSAVPLNGAPGGGTWTSSNGNVTINATPAAVGVSNGTATLTYTNAAGCYKTLQVTVSPAPATPNITGPTSVAAGDSIALTGTAAGGVWSVSNTAVATISIDYGVVTGVAPGTVVVGYTLSHFCGSKTTTVNITVTETPERGAYTSTPAPAQATIYPNPTTGIINILAPTAGTFTLYAIDGRTISQHPIQQGANTITLPHSLASGNYIAKFKDAQGKTDLFRIELQ